LAGGACEPLAQLFAAADDPAARAALVEAGESVFVDLTPAGVAAAARLGLQREPLRARVDGGAGL
jgi:hypothetical protein